MPLASGDFARRPVYALMAADRGALAALLVPPPPTSAILATIRAVIATHNPLEEGADGVYAECEQLAGAEADALAERIRPAPEVPVNSNVGGERVAYAMRRALACAGYPESLVDEG